MLLRALFLLLLPLSLAADPWGKDADMVQSARRDEAGRCKTALFGPFAEAGIWFHQEIVSPADGPRSHFYPSSSQYTLEAMRQHGFFKGFLMGCDRLMRENPEDWVYPTVDRGRQGVMKYDPVP